jgi:hypothetical protein
MVIIRIGGNPTTPEMNSPVYRITLKQHPGERTLLQGNENDSELFYWGAGGWRATGQQHQGFTTKSPSGMFCSALMLADPTTKPRRP